jgi:hypothetical protein
MLPVEGKDLLLAKVALTRGGLGLSMALPKGSDTTGMSV